MSGFFRGAGNCVHVPGVLDRLALEDKMKLCLAIKISMDLQLVATFHLPIVHMLSNQLLGH